MRTFYWGFLSCVGLLIGGAGTVHADEIASCAALQAALTAGGEHRLVGDIDLTGVGYEMVPEFSGRLDGGGHVIRGLGTSALVHSLSGTIENLTVDGRVGGENTFVPMTAGKIFGVYAVTNAGGVIRNCSVRGYTLGKGGSTLNQKVGLFAGVACEGALFERCETGEECTLEVAITAHSGGIVGYVTAVSNYVGNVAILRDCVNYASTIKGNNYNGNSGVGGMIGGVEYTGIHCPTTRLERCVNKGSITFPSGNFLYGGGLVGRAYNGNFGSKVFSVTLEFVDCRNEGDIVCESPTAQSYLGGFIGSLQRNCGSGYFSNCVNRANVISYTSNTNSSAGGFVGHCDTLGQLRNVEGINCANYGDITSPVAGGFVGFFNMNAGWNCGKMLFYNSATYGTITGLMKGQFVGRASSGTSANVRLLWTNGWCFDRDFYDSTKKEPEIENVLTPDQEGYTKETATVALNANVTPENGYVQWTVGELYPELGIFAKPSYTLILVK